MGNAQKLSALGVKDEDLVMMVSNATSRCVEKCYFCGGIVFVLMNVVGICLLCNVRGLVFVVLLNHNVSGILGSQSWVIWIVI